MIVQKESLENESCSYVAEISAILCIYMYVYRLYVVVLTSSWWSDTILFYKSTLEILGK